MMPVPIPAHIRGRRVVLGEPGMNPADPDAPMPVEYLIGWSALYPGKPTFSALLRVTAEDLVALADSGFLWLTLDGGELPWSLEVAPIERVMVPVE